MFLLLLSFSAIIFGFPQNVLAEGSLQINYEKQTDRVSISASNISLTRLLTDLSAKTGIEVMIDPRTEKKISLLVKNRPLENALKKIGKNLSYIILYDAPSDNTANSTILAYKLLPKGMTDSPNLISVDEINRKAAQENLTKLRIEKRATRRNNRGRGANNASWKNISDPIERRAARKAWTDKRREATRKRIEAKNRQQKNQSNGENTNTGPNEEVAE